jgi:tetratricopeptide (TPR) repeat protein
MRYFQAERFRGNDLPIMTLATDRVSFPVSAEGGETTVPSTEFPEWQRWNDYGIGLLRKSDMPGSSGELRQAEAAFQEVERLGRPDGPLNLARVYLREGRLEDAQAALARAAAHDPPAPPWSVAWFTGLVNKQNGYLDEAIANFESIVTLDSEETRRRDFDFSKDYRLLGELGQTIYERAKSERGEERRASRETMLRRAAGWFERALEIDPEDLAAHYNLAAIHEELGDAEAAQEHRRLHAKYKPDDNARDIAVATARLADPAANHAAEAVVIYDLRRPGAFELVDVRAEEQN